MIVACPSCQRRYRHDFVVAAAPPTARCSACDERFPLDRPKRSYRLVLPVRQSPSGDLMPPPPIAAPPLEQQVSAEIPVGIEMPTASPVAIDTLVEPGPASPLRAFGESLVALVPSGLGATLAYHFSGPLGQDPITWAALGGAVGLLLGWACLLWITHGD